MIANRVIDVAGGRVARRCRAVPQWRAGEVAVQGDGAALNRDGCGIGIDGCVFTVGIIDGRAILALEGARCKSERGASLSGEIVSVTGFAVFEGVVATLGRRNVFAVGGDGDVKSARGNAGL